jgi:antitoxin component YwqK of YwqJK toxin-antitoxin module
MLRLFRIVLFCVFSIICGCKTNQIVNKEREGRWIFSDTINDVVYKSRGKYKKGIEQKTWRYFANNKRIKKEKYKNGVCYTKNFFDNGRLKSKGKTQMITLNHEIHWFYFGDWQFYDESGKLTEVKKYEKGKWINDSL